MDDLLIDGLQDIDYAASPLDDARLPERRDFRRIIA